LAFVLVVLSALAAPVTAQRSEAALKNDESDAVELYQSLLDLQNPWTVMCIAAHPDDEDGATLTVLRRKYGAHTVTVFSTYGEGGQNATGPELYEELGAIRARETLKAAEIQGSEAYFLGLLDFGFSKSAEEAFRIWGHDEALRRMVLKIRQLRPDVIITNHDTTRGHGHHQATGRLALEAFDAAADARRFPEQLRGGLRVWQAQRLFVRIGSPGGGTADTTARTEAQRANKLVTINRNERDNVRGETYSEQALRALQQHASQGPWPKTLPASWASTTLYRLALSAKNTPPLPPNAQTFLDGMSLTRSLADTLTPLAARALLLLYSANEHQSIQSILSALVSARKGGLFTAPSSTSDQPRFQLMTERLNRALAVASGIKAVLIPHNKALIPGTTTNITLKITNDGKSTAHIQNINPRGLRLLKRSNFPVTLAPGQTMTVELQHSTPRDAAVSVPHAEHLYDGKLFGEELAASINVLIDGATFPVNAMTRIDVAPVVEIKTITPSVYILTPASIKALSTFTLRLANNKSLPFAGRINTTSTINKNETPVQVVKLAGDEVRDFSVTLGGLANLVDLDQGTKHSTGGSVSFSVARSNAFGSISKKTVPVIWTQAHVAPNLSVGYIPSVDDTLRNALTALGVQAKELSVGDVRAGDLQNYHAIIIDNRGYQAHPELVGANSRLMDYVQAGGTLIVFYHRTNEWNPDEQRKRPQLAPYPIILGNSRVTDETAQVEFVEPEHPLLNYPNKIAQEDFAGWIQERGLYYPEKWDSHYSAPLAMSDGGEPRLRGGLLAADYGRGRYIYTSMVWYRQLRAGVPGAFRVLANMISYGR
jgi:LmbE family N-acetylglucosaminyl deacetylase